jgi:hypothetical protein
MKRVKLQVRNQSIMERGEGEGGERKPYRRMYSQMNKLSLIWGCNYLKIYKENFDVSNEGPSSGVTDFYTFRYSCIPTNESLFILLALPTLAKTV